MKNLNNTYVNKSNQNIISIPLVHVLIVFISIVCLILFSFSKNVMSSNDSNDLLLNEDISFYRSEKEENIDDTLTVVLPNEEKTIDEIETEEIVEQPEESQEQKTTNTFTYTTSKGKNYDVIGSLNIPSLGINYPILAETSEELLKISLNKYWGANPNEVGNMVIVGHNYKNNKFFGKLPKINENAIIEITDLNGKTMKYTVYDTDIIDPYDNACTSQLTNGKIEITLITCYYENGSTHANKRFVVKARAN